jgi:hypothetical protein
MDDVEVVKALRVECLRCVVEATDLHGSVARLLATLGRSREWINDFVKSQFDNLEYAVSTCKTQYAIPKIYHKIWLTNEQKPSFPPEEFIQKLLVSTENIDTEWIILFWVNNKDVEAQMVEYSRLSRVTLIVMRFDRVFGQSNLYPVVDSLLRDQKYVLAGDVAKLCVIGQFGGIYSDLGLQLDRRILSITQFVDYAFIFGHAVFLQTSLLAARPNSELMTIFANIMTRPEALPRSFILLGDSVTATDEVRVFSGVCATFCMLLFGRSDNIFLLLPDKGSFHLWEAKGSWYKKAQTSGNIKIADAKPTFITDALLDAASRRLPAKGDEYDIDDTRAFILTLSTYENEKAMKRVLGLSYLTERARAIIP